MNEEINNQEGIAPTMNPDEAAALLSWSTGLSDQFVRGGKPRETQAETPTEQPEQPQIDEKQIDAMVEEKVRGVLKEEMKGLRDELKAMLEDEEGED